MDEKLITVVRTAAEELNKSIRAVNKMAMRKVILH